MPEESGNKITGFIIKHRKGLFIFVFVLLVGSMLLRGVMQYPTLKAQQKEIANLNNQIEYEQQRQKEVEELSKRVDSDEYIAKIATEKLGLIPGNAKVFIDVSEEPQQ